MPQIGRGRPIIGVRVPKATHEAVKFLSSATGHPSASAFVREMLISMTSGDYERLAVFQGKLFSVLTDKKQLSFLADLEAPKRRKPSTNRKAHHATR